MENSIYNKQLYAILEKVSPVEPALWEELKAMVKVTAVKKRRYISGEEFDLHIVLSGMIIHRLDGNHSEGGQVQDFISSGQCFHHLEKRERSSFEADEDSVVVLIRNKKVMKLMVKYPKFAAHLQHFYAEALLRRTYRGTLIGLIAQDRKARFKKNYPAAYLKCSINDKSSFLGMTASYYSKIDI